MTDLSELKLRLHSVSVMRDLLCDPVINSLSNFLDLTDTAPTEKRVGAYAELVHHLYTAGGGDLGKHIEKIVFESENIYVRLKGKGIMPSDELKKSYVSELETFDMIASLSPDDLLGAFSEYSFAPRFCSTVYNVSAECMCRTENIEKYGYGIYAKYRMFYIDASGNVTPVRNPDPITLNELIDYKREQKLILDNTKALLSGKPAANILLTGDAGTGKSSTIKAVANELCSEGLRIIEVRKEQLHAIPALLDELNENPLRFILFIDDLSFTKDDDDFSALKAILEGSVSARSANVVIYATSNRRHLVKETFTDREGDDVHFNDTLQQILSLSERFGLQLTFSRPDKTTYLDIVHGLAKRHGLTYSVEKLDTAAERFALKRGTRSARAAKQFIDGLIANGTDDVL